MPSRMIACSLALLAFAAAIVAGVAVGNPAITTLWRALLAMVACYAVGALAGRLAEHALHEHIDQYKQAHPLEPADQATKDSAEVEGSAPVDSEPPAEPDAPARRGSDQEGEVASTDGAASSVATTEQAAA